MSQAEPRKKKSGCLKRIVMISGLTVIGLFGAMILFSDPSNRPAPRPRVEQADEPRPSAATSRIRS